MDESSARADLTRWRALMAEGRYREAWPFYEARRALASYDTPTPISAAPEWRGEDPRGKRIAVCAEQGFGDQLLFGRYLPELAARGADIVVMCHPAVLGRTFEAAGFWTRPLFVNRPIEACDAWTLIGSLPYRLGLTGLPPAGYLPFPLASGGGVGVLTSGSPAHWNDANRSLPPAEAARLRGLGRDLDPSATGAADFLETAELVAGSTW